MCFSASVSYGSAALLVATGAATTIGNTSNSVRMIAAVPFLFGLQQIAEGVIWQTMAEAGVPIARHMGALVFLFFAYVIWTAWIPWSLFFIEPVLRRRKILKFLGFFGCGCGAMASWVLFGVEVRAYVTGHSLAYAFYDLHRTWPPNLEASLYLISTVIPFFVSSLRTIKIAGYLIAASMILARIINEEAASSIWCLFAALISFFIAVNVLWLQKGRLN